jgi:16S rRNA (adenine1518-N6/adenine1519-N6)-dimethyltransferase
MALIILPRQEAILMQNKTKIQELLLSAGIRPNKSLGQHFLIDLNLMRLLLRAANVTKDDIVLEVGCGTGSLTQELAERAAAVIAVEIDNALAEIARQQLSDKKNVQIINADILRKKSVINPDVTKLIKSFQKKSAGRFLLVSNLPYNVASPLIINLVTGSPAADAMYVTVQKEVAERMTAKAGTKKYGTLSVLLQATGDVKIERVLPAGVFWPKPKVGSAMVSFIRSSKKTERIKSIEQLCRIVNLFMQHRRKMLKSITKSSQKGFKQVQNFQQIFESCGIEPNSRPAQLSPGDYVKIANALA